MGGGTQLWPRLHGLALFQSTLPVGGETRNRSRWAPVCCNFNPPSPWGERRFYCGKFNKGQSISIHPPRGGRDNGRLVVGPEYLPFQSTLPVGGETFPHLHMVVRIQISIHPPRVGRDRCCGKPSLLIGISIHPPRGGRDLMPLLIGSACNISIHPPRGGRDTRLPISASMISYFNPPSPWGEGLYQLIGRAGFQSISIHPPRGGRDVSVAFGIPLV